MSKIVSKFALAAGVVLAMAFTFSCSPPDDEGGGTCSANFRTVTIGTQTWAAENLNCDVEGSKCYNNDPANCAKYGRLYDWATAMALSSSSSCNSSTNCASQIKTKHRGICPSGWHIPSDADWEILIDYVGGYKTAGTKLKATSGWDNDFGTGRPGNGTDDYGFSALPGGYYSYSGGTFLGGGDDGSWWSADDDDDNSFYTSYCDMQYEFMGLLYTIRSYLLSVRCLQD